MPFPTPIVEIAFDGSPYDVSPTWTDVTSWVRSLSTSRGRSDDWDDFYGSAYVVLNNRTRLFDPYYTSGTYYGKLLPRKQIRIRAQTNDGGVAVTHDVFRGFVSGWSPSWTDAGTDSTVTLSCFDALQLLGAEQLPPDWSRQYILSTNPRHYYPCDEPVTPYSTGTLADYGSFPLPMTVTTAASSGTQLAVGLVNSSITGTGSDAANSALGNVNSSPGSFSVSAWVVPDSSATGSVFLQGYINNHGFFFSFDNATSKFRVEVTEPSFGNSKVATTNIAGWDSGASRLMSFTWNSSTRTIAIYIDGILIANTTTNNAGIYVPFNELVNIGTGSVQQVIVWDGVQTQAVIQEIFKYSTVALPETTTARAERIIAQTPFSSSLCSFPASPAVSVLDITDNAPSAAPELRRVAASECAPLFVSKSGVVTMYQQQQQFTQTRSIVSQVTYGAGGTDMGQVLELTPDGDSMRNEANIQMSGGGVYVQRNTASIAAYGTSSATVETQVQTLADAQEVANITTGFGGQVYPRLSPVQVVLDSTNNWSPTMALELMDRITVVAQPPSGGNAITVPMLVQNIRHDAVPGFWQTTLEGSARWAAAFIINQSLIGGTDLLG
jgi:hypothetical protein